MKITYKIRDRRGERTIAEDMFPIIIGTGPTADIRIDELTADVEVAYIGPSYKPVRLMFRCDTTIENWRVLPG